MALEIPSISIEYLRVPITGPTGVDLTELAVELAVVPDGQIPAPADWQTGLWIGSDAAALIGTGALTLTRGTYDVYVKITSSPEVPVLLSGSIYIT